ncbi:MAG: hypothetical protein WA743_13990 [Pseudolabrys sp.]
MQTLKARGQRGSWFARIGDEDIPCAWLQWRTGNHYFDPAVKPTEGKWPKYIEALKQGLKVALTDKREDEEGDWHRDGYIGLFEIANVVVSDHGLEFDFVQRLAHLK